DEPRDVLALHRLQHLAKRVRVGTVVAILELQAQRLTGDLHEVRELLQLERRERLVETGVEIGPGEREDRGASGRHWRWRCSVRRSNDARSDAISARSRWILALTTRDLRWRSARGDTRRRPRE